MDCSEGLRRPETDRVPLGGSYAGRPHAGDRPDLDRYDTTSTASRRRADDVVPRGQR